MLISCMYYVKNVCLLIPYNEARCCPLILTLEYGVLLFVTELLYGVPVIPDGIEIYETYHPGAVVRILACNANPVSSSDRKRKPGEVE